MRIGIDIDGVLADVVGPCMAHLSTVCGQPLTKEDFVAWYYPVKALGISQARFVAMLDQVWDAWRDVELEEPQSPGVLQGLAEAGHRLSIISQRTRQSLPCVVQWLDAKAIPFHDLLLVHEDGCKLDFPVDVLVDDKPGLALEAAQYPDQTVLLRDQPWNRDLAGLPPNVRRIHGLADLPPLLLGSHADHRR